MNAYSAPSNGYFTGVTYNRSSNSDTVTKEYLAEYYLPRTGNPTDEAEIPHSQVILLKKTISYWQVHKEHNTYSFPTLANNILQ